MSYENLLVASKNTLFLTVLTVVYGIALIFAIVLLISHWKIFTKAGEKGWYSLIPFYSTYVLFKIAFGNGLMALLLLIPYGNIAVYVILNFLLGKAFDKGIMYRIGLTVLPIVFYPMLAFGKSEYKGHRDLI